MEKDARKLLQRMIKCNGFIADGVLQEPPRFWSSDSRCSSSLIHYGLLIFLQKKRFVEADKCGRYLITERGRRFARPWYKRWFELT
jgi:hypothetical protein